MFRVPHCLVNWLTDGGEVVSLTRRPCSIPQKHFLVLISVRGRINSRATVELEGSIKLKKFNGLIGTRTSDLSASSILPQPSMLPRALSHIQSYEKLSWPRKILFCQIFLNILTASVYVWTAGCVPPYHLKGWTDSVHIWYSRGFRYTESSDEYERSSYENKSFQNTT
jgi:hypothetical protein